MEMQAERVSWPENIILVGGGRWARVLLDVLCSLVPLSVSISVHSRHHILSMADWAKRLGIDGRIRLSPDWPPTLSDGSSAVIVANAARDHAGAVEWALSAGVSVLVEKPMAPTLASASRLTHLASTRNVRLAPAHIFLFARYIANFSKLISNAGEIHALRVDWADPKHEVRYGESKRYDPGLTVFSDWLPHIIPITSALLPTMPDSLRSLKVRRGGAAVELEMTAGDIPCVIHLERNAERRMRIVQGTAAAGTFQLDFSIEPGTIVHGESVTIGDELWNSDKRPVACMLTAFLKWAACGETDHRFDVGPSLKACRIIDQAAEKYYSALRPWLITRLSERTEVDDSLRYALSELILADGPLSDGELDRRIKLVKSRFTGADGARRSQELAEVSNVPDLLKTLTI